MLRQLIFCTPGLCTIYDPIEGRGTRIQERLPETVEISWEIWLADANQYAFEDYFPTLSIRLYILRKGLGPRTNPILGMGCFDHQSYSIGRDLDSYRAGVHLCTMCIEIGLIC